MNQTNWAISKVQNILNYCFPSPCFSVVFFKLKHCSEKRFWSSSQTFIDATFIAFIFFKRQARDSRSWVFTGKLQIKFYDRYPAEVQVQKGF